MKNVLLSAAAITCAASTAIAGNLADPVIEPAPIAPMANWDGAYVGANLTWGQADLDAKGELRDVLRSNGLGETLSDLDGVGGGVRVGYDWQFNSVVLGAGAEYNFGEIEGDFKLDPTLPIDVKISDTATVFARIGYDAGDWLPYLLAGYTWADGKVSIPSLSESTDLDGATVGLGVERRLADRWTVYGEWTYTDFGTISDTEGLAEVSMNQIKIGANYRF